MVKPCTDILFSMLLCVVTRNRKLLTKSCFGNFDPETLELCFGNFIPQTSDSGSHRMNPLFSKLHVLYPIIFLVTLFACFNWFFAYRLVGMNQLLVRDNHEFHYGKSSLWQPSPCIHLSFPSGSKDHGMLALRHCQVVLTPFWLFNFCILFLFFFSNFKKLKPIWSKQLEAFVENCMFLLDNIHQD